MSGLLDGNWSPDSDRNDSINQGLLAMGLQLMSSKGRFGDALGQAGLAGMDRQRSVYTGLQGDRLRQMQLQQAKQQFDEQQAKTAQMKITQEHIRSLQAPNPQDESLYAATRAGAMSYGDLMSQTRKSDAPIPLAPGTNLLHPRTFATLASNPKESPSDPLIRLMEQSGIDPMSPQGQQLIRAKLQKDTTHSPGTSINTYGAPTPIQLPGGGTGFMQPSNRGGAVSPMVGADGRPMLKPVDRDALPKPLPNHAMKMQQESLDKVGIASSINADLDGIAKQIDAGKLDFGPVSNLANAGRNMAGMSSDKSRNFATFKATLERLRNESLRLNIGVQTDGDSQRAWNELVQNINDTAVVKQRLGEIQAINKRGADLQRMRVDSIRNEYRAEPLDASAYAAQPAAIGGGGFDAEKERRYQEFKAKQ